MISMMMRTRMRMRRCVFISCKSHGMYEHVGMVEIQTICDISLRTIVKRRRNNIFELVFIKAFGVYLPNCLCQPSWRWFLYASFS